MIPYQLTLDYTLAPGWLAPFVDGVLAGQAMARRCDACQKASFPPLRFCQCGAGTGTWIKLSGRAKITLRTEGADGSFALVRFDGADTQSVVQLRGIDTDVMTGCLVPGDAQVPQLVLGPDTKKASQ